MTNDLPPDEHARAFWYATTGDTGEITPQACIRKHQSHAWLVTDRLFYCKRCHASLYEAEVLGHIKFEAQ